MKKRIVYIFIVTLIAFVIWLIGEVILMLELPDSGLTAARIWAIAVFSLTCVWNLMHFYRAEKKKREEKENEEYKSVY